MMNVAENARARANAPLMFTYFYSRTLSFPFIDTCWCYWRRWTVVWCCGSIKRAKEVAEVVEWFVPTTYLPLESLSLFAWSLSVFGHHHHHIVYFALPYLTYLLFLPANWIVACKLYLPFSQFSFVIFAVVVVVHNWRLQLWCGGGGGGGGGDTIDDTRQDKNVSLLLLSRRVSYIYYIL